IAIGVEPFAICFGGPQLKVLESAPFGAVGAAERMRYQGLITGSQRYRTRLWLWRSQSLSQYRQPFDGRRLRWSGLARPQREQTSECSRRVVSDRRFVLRFGQPQHDARRTLEERSLHGDFFERPNNPLSAGRELQKLIPALLSDGRFQELECRFRISFGQAQKKIGADSCLYQTLLKERAMYAEDHPHGLPNGLRPVGIGKHVIEPLIQRIRCGIKEFFDVQVLAV